MIDLSKKKVLIYGYGLFECFLAMRMARDFKEVMLYTPWKGSYPLPTKNLIGTGLPGVTKVDDFFAEVDGSDLICFFDVGDGDLQQSLRAQGKRVLGAGTADILENDRVGFKKVLESVGLPVGPYQVAKGMDALHAALKAEKDKWVKVSKYRGITETFHHKDYRYTLPRLDQIATRLGAYRNEQEFMIEDPIPGVECGDDRFMCNGKPLPIATYGFEIKDQAYLCKAMPVEEMPVPVRQVADALAPVYQEHNVCSMMSSEIRIGADKKPYFTDQCSRAGSPPSELMSELYSNFSEILWAIAGGEMVTPKPIAKYAAEVLIKSEMAPTDWVPMDFDVKDLDRLKMRNLCGIDVDAGDGKKKRQFYYIPQDGGTIIGGAIGFGDTREEAQLEALRSAEKLQCEESHYDTTVFDQYEEELAKAEKFGLGKF